MSEKRAMKSTGAVMVVGGGIAGVQAALDLAESGYYVYLVEKGPSIGGVMAQLEAGLRGRARAARASAGRSPGPSASMPARTWDSRCRAADGSPAPGTRAGPST